MTFAGTGPFRMVEGSANREAKSPVKSTGLESKMCPQMQFLTNPYLSFTEKKIPLRMDMHQVKNLTSY